MVSLQLIHDEADSAEEVCSLVSHKLGAWSVDIIILMVVVEDIYLNSKQ